MSLTPHILICKYIQNLPAKFTTLTWKTCYPNNKQWTRTVKSILIGNFSV